MELITIKLANLIRALKVEKTIIATFVGIRTNNRD